MNLFKKKIITITYDNGGKKITRRYEILPLERKITYNLHISPQECIRVRIEL